MNPYNSLAPAPKSDTIEFVAPDADIVRLVQLSIWRNRLDQRRAVGGESPTPTSGKRVES